jgi:hypothetical protein
MVIMLVAVFILFIVGAMAALAIDLVTLYTARSEAQLAADGAALAGARVLANSGLTSGADPIGAEDLATTIAKQVATHNDVGGRTLNATTEVFVSFNDRDTSFPTNPHVKVQTKRTDLPTFFARLWGNNALTVSASATAEAYNPSGANALGVANPAPVAPVCVKPWVLPNIDPSPGGTTIFAPATGAITNPALLGWPSTPAVPLRASCGGNCATSWPTPIAWRYYPGAVASFPAPTQALPSCGLALNAYQKSIAGCVQTPIACGSTVDLDTANHAGRNFQTAEAVNCLTHSTANAGDSIDPASIPPSPFQFLSGADNPVVQAGALAAGVDVLVSDSLVTVPVYDSSALAPPSPVVVIGFVQLFLNPDGFATPLAGPSVGHVKTTVINMAGCGTAAAGTTIFGNGASPVAVRLISP